MVRDIQLQTKRVDNPAGILLAASLTPFRPLIIGVFICNSLVYVFLANLVETNRVFLHFVVIRRRNKTQGTF